jgi:NADH dehydrogenase
MALNIVIIGGGAGGLELATTLGRKHAKDADTHITLVDRAHSHLWKPLLHEVAAGTLNSNDDELSYLAQAFWSSFHFELGALLGLDRTNKRVTIAPSTDAAGNKYMPQRTLPYDLLIIAIGSVTNDFGITGVAENCFYLDAREQADTFHQHLVRACYAANTQSTPIARGQLDIAIAGGGATGVELAAELHHAVHMLVGFGLDNINVAEDIRIHLVEASDRVLPGLPPKVAESTRLILEELGIVVHTGRMITAATPSAFLTDSGDSIAAQTKVWAAGIMGAPVLASLDGLECNRANQLMVRPTLQTLNDDAIFALGDCAACALPGGKHNVPPRAQAAHQQATHMARSVAHWQLGKPLADYVYKDFGSLVNLSQRSAIGNLMGRFLNRRRANFPIEGRLARWAYLSLYKMHQVAVSGVVRTILMTCANMLTRASKPRLKLH